MNAAAREALAVLRAAFRKHVEDLAERLKPRLLAGEFTVPDDSDAINEWEALQDICSEAPLPWGQGAPLLVIVCVPDQLQGYALELYRDDDIERCAGFIIARGVREIAVARWNATLPNLWKVHEEAAP